jgi:hypothetical protein
MLAKRSPVSKKFYKREALALRISCSGFEMFSCSAYDKNNTKCIVLDKENSSRCSECVLRKVKCNIEGVPVGE